MIKVKKNQILLLLTAVVCFFAGILTVNLKTKQVEASEALTQYAQVTDDYYCLRDEDMFIIEYQGTFGTCWSFAALKAIENTVTRNTDIVYNFSEAWVTLCAKVDNPSKNLGDGNSFSACFDLLQEYGVVYEEDMPYEVLFHIDNSNYQEMYDYYKQFANKNLLKNVTKVGFYASASGSEQKITDIKTHIITDGALYVGVNWNDSTTYDNKLFVYSKTESTYNGHAITIIGWDDNIKFVDGDNITHTGAFICLNSWGANNDEIIYLPYGDAYLQTQAYGVTYPKSNDLHVEITSSTSQIKNFAKGQYKQTPDAITQTIFNQKNVFYSGEEINVTYDYNISNQQANTQINLDITKNNTSQQTLFDVTLDISQDNFVIENISQVDSGVYFIQIEVDYENDGENDLFFKTPIYVFSGAEFSDVTGSMQSSSLFTFQSFNKVINENNNTFYGYTTSNITICAFNLANFSTVASYKLNSGMSTHKNTTFVPATSSSYSKGTIYIQISSLSSYKKYEHKVTFTLLNGKQVEIKIITYRLSSNDQKAYIFSNFTQNFNNANFVAIGNNYPTVTLNSVIDENYVIDGFYYDAQLTNKVQNNSIDKSKFKTVICDNYANYNKQINYLILYLNATEKTSLQFNDYLISNTLYYGDAINVNIKPAQYGSGDYTYTLITNNLPNGLAFNTSTLKISGIPLSAGNFSLTVKVVDNLTITEKTATISLTILKRKVTYTIDDKQSKYGEALKALTGSITSGSVYGNDNLNINLYTSATSISNFGEYQITGSYNNSNYEVTFINGTYTITKKQITATVTNYVGTYDGNFHTITVNVSMPTSGYQITYSYDDITYFTSPVSLKNSTNGKVMIYVKITANNYEDKTIPAYFNITQKTIDIIWEQTEFTYDGQEHCPTFDYDKSDVILGETINLTPLNLSAQINAGEYTASVTTDSADYVLINSKTTFIIKKAKHTLDDITIKIKADEVVEFLSEITLPEHYAWVNGETKVERGVNYYEAIYTPVDTLNYETQNVLICVDYDEKTIPIELLVIIIGFTGVLIADIFLKIVNKKKKKKGKKQQRQREFKINDTSKVTIKFVTNCSTILPNLESLQHISINLPVPERKFFKFKGWYTDVICKIPYQNNGTNPVLILYAKWEID